MHSIWNGRQSFNVTEQRLCDEARMLRKSGWLAELRLAVIRKRLVNASVEEIKDNGFMLVRKQWKRMTQ